MSNQQRLVDNVIDSFDWSKYQLMDGPATEFGEHLRELIYVDDPARAAKIWDLFVENHVFAQDDIYRAAEPTVDVLLAALVDQQEWIPTLLDLLFLLIQPASYGNDALSQACLQKASRGSWLLVRIAVHGSANEREASLEVLDLVSTELAAWVRTATE